MEIKQILILLLCAAAARSRCHNGTNLEAIALKRLQRHYPQPLTITASEDSSSSCPVELYQKLPSVEVKDRSLSPWKWRTVTRPDYFPHTYTEAVCLCNGCILMENGTVQHSYNYNSIPLLHTFMFLKRDRHNCEEGKYRLVEEMVQVSVGCTCVRAKTVRVRS
ncbi:interleukin-17C [Cyprinodon tularosa]|uniref:interleukin-17C n=1 Tax=Cyprinodon tularosa TaxID=77115 RepID=UPI0018E2552C|nr:interleukin-17C [Cyprinodon tularosa]